MWVLCVCVCACVQTNVVDEEARKRMNETLFIFDRAPEKMRKAIDLGSQRRAVHHTTSCANARASHIGQAAELQETDVLLGA